VYLGGAAPAAHDARQQTHKRLEASNNSICAAFGPT
jgi:hypothetical protein